MTRYSSDSDSERNFSKIKRKYSRRSSSLDSSGSSSSYHMKQKHLKSKRKYRSRSRSKDKDNSSRSYKSTKDSSRERRKHQQQKSSRSSSIDRNQDKKRSISREKSTSRSSSSQSNNKFTISEKPNSISNDNLYINNAKIKTSVINEINSDEFIPKEFVSSAKNNQLKLKNIIIDINTDVVHVPQIIHESDFNDIFHSSITADKETKFDKWVKKLYALRQKIINELKST